MAGNPTFFHIMPMEMPQIELKQCGTQKCSPGYYYGPAIRDIYLLHYIASGKGTFSDGKTTYELSAGDIFYIGPGISTFYSADNLDPWEYSWIGFSGNSADYLLHQIGLTAETPTMHAPECGGCFADIVNECSSGQNNEFSKSLYILSRLIEIFAQLYKFSSAQTYSFSDHIINFFTNNIGQNISISKLADDYGFSRTHFSSIFKKETGYSPKQFLLNLRIEKARCLLLDTELDISCIARSVGYDDPLLFSKQFKKKMGVSPRALRRQINGAVKKQDENKN